MFPSLQVTCITSATSKEMPTSVQTVWRATLGNLWTIWPPTEEIQWSQCMGLCDKDITLMVPEVEWFFTLLALCEGNLLVTGGFPSCRTSNAEHQSVCFVIKWVSGWLNLTAFYGQRGPCNPYKLCDHNLYIGIIIFPHINNTIYRLQFDGLVQERCNSIANTRTRITSFLH